MFRPHPRPRDLRKPGINSRAWTPVGGPFQGRPTVPQLMRFESQARACLPGKFSAYTFWCRKPGGGFLRAFRRLGVTSWPKLNLQTACSQKTTTRLLQALQPAFPPVNRPPVRNLTAYRSALLGKPSNRNVGNHRIVEMWHARTLKASVRGQRGAALVDTFVIRLDGPAIFRQPRFLLTAADLAIQRSARGRIPRRMSARAHCSEFPLATAGLKEPSS